MLAVVVVYGNRVADEAGILISDGNVVLGKVCSPYYVVVVDEN